MHIARVETIPLRLPVKAPLVESGGTFAAFDHVIVKLHADDGRIGLGEVEAYPSFERPGVETQAGILAIIRDHLGPAVLGESPFDLGRIWARMDKAVNSYWRVKAAIDIACHDLMGQKLGVPVVDLLGGKLRDSYVVEGVGYGISIGEPEEVARQAKDAVARGYRQLELKAGETPARDAARLRLVRAAIGREIPIKIDFNGFYDTKTAIRLIRELEEYGIEWIEQPARPWDLEGLAMVRNAVMTTIVVDESAETPEEMMRVVRAGAADAVHVKPTIKGGFTMARRIVAIAEAGGLSIVPGTSAPSGVGMAAAQAFICASRELSGGAHGSPLDILVDDVITEPIPADSTRVHARTGVGLGIALDEAKIAKYRADR